MKIIVICEAVFPDNKGGLERWISWLATQFHRRGYELTYLNNSLIDEIRDGIKFQSVGTTKLKYSLEGKRSILNSIYFGYKVFIKLCITEYDVIYSTQAPIVSLPFIQFAKLFKRKKTIFLVEWLEIWSLNYWREYLGFFWGSIAYLFQKISLKFGDKKICFTESIYKNLISSNPLSQVVKLPGIIMEQNEIKFEGNKHKENIIFLSRFVSDKQPFLAIDAVIKFRSTGWLGNFYIIGSGPLESKIKNYVNSNHAENYIKVYVNIEDYEVRAKLTTSFALLHTSKREGFGLSIIEAAQAGVPSILVNYPENLSLELEIVPELVCNNNDPSEVSKKLLYAYQNQEYLAFKVEDWLKKDYRKRLGNDSINKIDAELKKLF